MKRLRAALVRLAGLVARRRREREFRDELESHLAMHVDDNLRRGMTAGEARRQAHIALGGVEATRLAYRDQASVPWLEQLVQDVRFALRQLAGSRGFTVTAVSTLGVALGVAVALGAFVDAALVEPLPYREPDRLLEVTESTPQIPRANLSWDDYLDWRRMATTLGGFDVHRGHVFALATGDGSERVRGVRVTPGFFRTLGVAPTLGRDFEDGEAEASVILSHAAWQARFGGRDDVIGRQVVLDGAPSTVIGVLPASFHFAPRGRAEMWIPFHPHEGCDERRSCHAMIGVGRLGDGVTVAAARAEMEAIAERLEVEYPDSNRSQGASVVPLVDAIVGDVRPVLLLLLAAAGLLLVIACVNVVSLLLVRSEGRKRELAVRSTLGASDGRLVRQLVTEAALLVAAAGAVGLLVAGAVVPLLAALVPDDALARMPFLDGAGVNLRVGAAAGVVALLATALFSLVPAVLVRRSEMRQDLADSGRGASGRTWRRLGFKLVVVELATAMVLLAGAGLLGRSLQRLLDVDLHFDPDRLATLGVSAPGPRFAEAEAAVRLGRQVVERVERLPGVRAAAATSVLPVSFNGNTLWLRFVGRPFAGEHNEVNMREVSAGYFATLGARLLRGRAFTDADTASAPAVAIVNRTLAQTYFPDQDPIGQRFGNVELAPESIAEIVGVVDDIREGPLSAEIWPAVYFPLAQSPESSFALVVRTEGDPRALLPALAAAVREVDAELSAVGPAAMRDRIEDSPVAYLQRSSAWLVAGFAALALLLGAVGLYGVVAYTVGQRSREIGLRVALGAQRRAVYALVLGEAGRLTALGILLGLAASVAAASLLRDLLFDTPPWDIPTLAAVAAVLALASLLASYLPARRAAATDPAEALRSE